MKQIFIFYIKTIRVFVSFIFNAYYLVRMFLHGKWRLFLNKEQQIYNDIRQYGWDKVVYYAGRTKYEYDGIMGFPDWSSWSNIVAYYRAYLKKLNNVDYIGDCDDVSTVARYLRVYRSSEKCNPTHKDYKIETWSIVANDLSQITKFHVVCLFYRTDDILVFSNGQIAGSFKSLQDISDKYIKNGYMIRMYKY